MSDQHRLVARSNTQTKLSPQLKARLKKKAHSDSEGSGESNSLSAESCNLKTVKDTPKGSKKNGRRGSEWEILEGLREGQRYDTKPSVFTGYLLKKRKWPLKGWHKRYFVIDKGILVYARGANDVARGKIHGSVDIGLSVISTKSKSKRIDIDAEEFIYHLKAKRLDHFIKWLEQLRQHRLYRQHLLTFGSASSTYTGNNASNDVANDTTFSPSSVDLSPSRDNSLKRNLLNSPPGTGRLGLWLVDSSANLDFVAKDLKQIGHSVAQLQSILDQVSSITLQPNLEIRDSLSATKKDRRKFGLKKKKSGKVSSGSSVELGSNYLNSDSDRQSLRGDGIPQLSSGSGEHLGMLSSSQTCLSATGLSGLANRPHSVPSTDYLTLPSHNTTALRSISSPDLQLREDFLVLAKDVVSNVKSCLTRLTTERDRMKALCDCPVSEIMPNGSQTQNSKVVNNLRNALNHALHQNNELRNRLNRVHDITDLADISARQYVTNLSYSSSCVSEFFDAEAGDTALPSDNNTTPTTTTLEPVAHEHSENSSSDENNSLSSDEEEEEPEEEEEEEEEEEGSVSSDNSDLADHYREGATRVLNVRGAGSDLTTGRRVKLPAVRPTDESFSLWNILCKNIGKDLSQISMPVALNEPLNMLQRMCEELEYSELLDKASSLDDPVERMVHVAAFAVSSYGSSYFRAGSKPFNPLLGETYECIREDRGFQFISEQVSHHPPVSVCHAESRNFIFWQDVRIKTKFWGKSMEFQPAGTVNIRLPNFNENYTWNKVTTCVHNLFSGQRWVDQYGELKITSSSGISCKLTFVKASYWSAKRHEVHGVVLNEEGKVLRNLFGKWSEAIYCGVAPSAKCIWRPGNMPEDYELYFGFTRFAIELNELTDEMSKMLPPTDTRFRPDQRLLEEGDVEGAENMKQVLEQNQRDRRKLQESGELPPHRVRWFDRHVGQDGDESETWIFNHTYWEIRQNPGFVAIEFPQPLW